MQLLIPDRPTMPIILPTNISKKPKASKSFWRIRSSCMLGSFWNQILVNKNFRKTTNRPWTMIKDILTFFDDNRLMFFQFFRVKNSKKV
jgi:hypothetical protein